MFKSCSWWNYIETSGSVSRVLVSFLSDREYWTIYIDIKKTYYVADLCFKYLLLFSFCFILKYSNIRRDLNRYSACEDWYLKIWTYISQFNKGKEKRNWELPRHVAINLNWVYSNEVARIISLLSLDRKWVLRNQSRFLPKR